MPQAPYVIGVNVTDSAGSAVADTVVTLKNETTNDELTETTNSNGKVIFDCLNFTSSYSNGDYLTYTVAGSGTNGDNLRFKIDSNTTGVIKKFKVSYP